MILEIIYWHNTETGEASNFIKVEKPTDIEAHREAQKEFFKKCYGYASDTSVIDYAVTIVNPKTGERGLHHAYFTPDAPVVEEPPIGEPEPQGEAVEVDVE